jgi:hypothetical protein
VQLRFRYFAPALLATLCSVAFAPRVQETPAHLSEAMKLVEAIKPDQTEYRHRPSVIHWPDEASGPECRTDCSGFVDLLLRHSYPWATQEWLEATMGKKRPLAGDYYDAIMGHKGFTIVERLDDIQPGDFLVMKYPVDSDNTGHMMLVASAPKGRKSSEPLVSGTTQWEVSVIDETSSYHGTGDTRYSPDEKKGGVGRGTFRLYADQDGKLAGYAWSITKKSKFYGPDERPIVAARLDTSGH